MPKTSDSCQFGGFLAPQYTPPPNQASDEQPPLRLLTEAELRELLYSVRGGPA